MTDGVLQPIGDATTPAQRLRLKWAYLLAAHMDANDKMRRAELQHRLAELGVSVSQQAIAQWLSGKTAPRPHHQAALARIFRVPVYALFPIEVMSA